MADSSETWPQGCRSMLAVPISFVSEHIETLEEMDMEYRELALESGIQRHAPQPLPCIAVNRVYLLHDCLRPFDGDERGVEPFKGRSQLLTFGFIMNHETRPS